MDFTGLTGEEIIAASRKYNEDIIKKSEEEKEQERKEMEEWTKEKGLPYKEYLPKGLEIEKWKIFRNENPNVYNDYMIEEEDLQDSKDIFIF
jgi:hypothetical protein